MRTAYDKKYQNPNFFNYNHWMFAPYVQALIRKYSISKGSCILDIGCGTGFFSELFYDEGMSVTGVDLSAMGIKTAKAVRPEKINLVVSDSVNGLAFKRESFDLIFCRGFSPYNSKDFKTQVGLTKYLVDFLRKSGIFIFSWSTTLSGLPSASTRQRDKGGFWVNHTLEDIKEHFSGIGSIRLLDLFFINRLEPLCFGPYGFTTFFNQLNSLLVNLTRIRGEAICVVQKLS